MAFDPIAYLEDPRWSSSRLGLERIRVLLDGLGRPQDRLKFVHVAGTNGKGSTCSYLASILRAAGYRTGLFTSPYIERFEERIQVDGKSISFDSLDRLTQDVRKVADAMADHPTAFELVTAVGFAHFAQCECDIVVLEVGLGGRYDATNVIDAPEVCAIAPIALDHTELLGSTVGQIACEKAAIVKSGCSVVSARQESAARMAIAEACRRNGCHPLFVSESDPGLQPDNTRIEGGSDGISITRSFCYRGCAYETTMLAAYQPRNAALAIEAACALRLRGWSVPQMALERGVAAATWPGRFEVVSCHPLVVVDGGHNPQGAFALVESLDDVFPGKKVVFVASVLADKDYRAMLRVVAPYGKAFVCTQSDNPRALPTGSLSEAFRQAGVGDPACVIEAESMEHAVQIAFEAADDGDVICAFGSLYSIAGMKAAFARELTER